MHLGGTHSAVYRIIMGLHLICVIGGFGLVLSKGLGSIWVVPGELGKARRRTWEAGIGLVYLVPVFGIAGVVISGGRWQFSQIWVGAGFALWLIAALVLSFVIRPGERRLMVLAGTDEAQASSSQPNEVRALLSRAAKASAVVDIAMAVAVVFMIVKPGA